MENKYKLIVSDIDGTLFNSDGKISNKNLEAIKDVTSKGIKFALVSGRSYGFLKGLSDEYGINIDAIGYNGTEIRDENGNIIWKRYMDKQDVIDIAKFLEDADCLFKVFTTKGIVCKRPRKIRSIAEEILKSRNEEITDETIKSKENDILLSDLIVSDMIEYIERKDSDIVKIEVIDSSRDYLNKISEKVKGISEVFITSSYGLNIEIMHKEVNKGNAIKNFAQYLGIDTNEVMAFGDNVNDIEMIEEAGMGVAVENAVDELKKVANFITLSNNEDGVAYAINKFVK